MAIAADDARWLAAVEDGTAELRHRDHLRLAVLALQGNNDLRQATECVATVLRRAAAAKGVPHKYNHTITVAWMTVIDHCGGATQSVDELLARHQWLSDKRILLRHYHSGTLARPEAKDTYIAPDLAPLP